MADDPVDISGMPDPGTIGLSPAPVDISSMPDPHTIGLASPGDSHFYGTPDPNAMTGTVSRGQLLKNAGDIAASVPHIAAGLVAAGPAGAASILGQDAGALGAAFDPTHAAERLSQGRDLGRDWYEKVSNLANYAPASGGARVANQILGLPSAVIKEVSDSTLGRILPDNAYQALGDVGQDVGTDLQALMLPEMGRIGFKGVRAASRAAKAGIASEAATLTPPPVEAPLTPPVGTPITGDTLKAQPNPIPAPEGTVHRTATEAKVAAGQAPTPTPPTGHAPVLSDGANAYTLAREAEARRRLAEDNIAPEPFTEPFAGRQAEHEGVVAQRNNEDLTGGTPSPGDTQRGSVRLFNSPADEGPKETPAPEQQSERAAHLDAIDKLSGGGLPTRRTSALTGDYNATGDDYQMKEVGNEQMRKQIASENDAMHSATENVHDSIGSQFPNSVDSTTLGDRGRVTRGAIQGIEGWFDKATDGVYDAARAANQGRAIPKLQRVHDYLNDDSNFTNDAEIGLQRAAKQRLDRLWTTGDPDKGAPPGSVNAAERFREFLNEKGKNPNAMGVATDLKNHVDMDVAEHGGPGLFQTARALRRHSYQMLEEPTGIKKLLAPSDSQGINHAIPEHKVMDYIADLPREQHEHVLNVLRAGAHLGDGELAEQSAGALREIQAHTVSRIHAAATNADGSWNARKFYNAADRYARNAPETFKDRPDVLNNLKTINDAGNTLHMDKHYPGAAAQTERTGAVGHALETGGHIAASIAHEIPVVGRFVGRRIESAVDRASGKIAESTRDRAVAQRLVDRTGKQRGAVGDLSQRDAVKHTIEDAPSLGLRYHSYETPNGGGLDVREIPELGIRKSYRASIPAEGRGQGWGTRTLQRAVDDAHAAGQKFHSDSQVSDSQAGAYANLKKLGYDVQMKPNDHVQGEYKAHGDHVFEVRPPKENGSTLNIGLHQGQEGQPGFNKMSKQQATGAVESTGAKVTKASVLMPDAHGVAEPTLVASTNRPLSEPEMQTVLAKTKQSAIPQRTDAGAESMHVAPGHEEIAKREGWDQFNPEYFRDHAGSPLGTKIPKQGGWIGEQKKRIPGELWHGTPTGDLRGGSSGLHLGTLQAAEDALRARIGWPADGRPWDGTREYGKTLLAGQDTLNKMGPDNISGHNVNAPKHDYYISEHPTPPTYGNGSKMPWDVKPSIDQYKITGQMSNTPGNPHSDSKANGYMQGALKKGNAKSGYYYTNIGEDSGSISAVVPNGGHVQRVPSTIGDYYSKQRVMNEKPPSGQRGSFSFQNDNELNRATASPRAGQRGGVERNPRSEFNANDQLAGGRKLSPEQQEVLRRLSGQRGSVRVMNEKLLAGAPEGDQPNGKARAAAAAYAKGAGIDYKPLKEYRYIDPAVAADVGNAYEEMKHDPTNPKVAKSYDAFKAETLAQYKQMQKAGVKVDLDKDYPYANPRDMHADVRANNHMSIYPTEEGFGTSGAPPSDHPMLEKAPVKMGGKDATYNDLFRAVHDYYGHAAEGNGFRANGEYNAWRAHRQMYSPEARGAMDSETLGQNSWVNSGPPGALNKGASSADTIYADQKAGLLPPKVVKAAEEGVGADEHHITNQLTDQERAQLRTDTTKRLIDAFHSAPATKEYAAAALAGAAKRGWYRDSAQAIVNQFGHEAPRFAGLLSAMSPQVSVQTNFANALKTYINWDKAGRPEDPTAIRRIMEDSSQKSPSAAPGSSNVLDAWVNNAVRALTADDPSNIKLSGPKVHSFYNNLTDKVHEVTNDAWMASFAKIDPAKLGGGLTQTGPGKSPSYMALSAKVRDAARMLSHLTGETWTPAEVQETVWSWAKTAYEHAEEKGDRSIPDLVKNGDITDELIRSTPDFHQLFSTDEHRGLLQSSRFAGPAEQLDQRQGEGAHSASSSKARTAAQETLRPHLLSAAERLEQVRQERRNQ